MASASQLEAAARKWEAARPDIQKRLADKPQDMVDFSDTARKREADLWIAAEEMLRSKKEELFAQAEEAFTKAASSWRVKKRHYVIADAKFRLRAAWVTCRDL